MDWYILIAAVLFFALLLFVVFTVSARRKDTEIREANREIQRKALRTFREAEDDFSSAKKELKAGDAWHIIDFVHDISERYNYDVPKYIEYEQAFTIINEMRQVKGPVAIILHTFGGYSFAAELIASAIKAHKFETRAYVPYVAMSGGTVIALAADKIFLGKNAALGPIDIQYGSFSISSLQRLAREKNKEAISDEFLLMSYEAEKDQNAAVDRALSVVDEHHSSKNETWFKELVSGTRSHDHRILFAEAKENGLNVEEDCPTAVYDLVDARLVMMKKYEEEAQFREDSEREKSVSSARLFSAVKRIIR